jgi:hypothetical protein
MVAATVTQDDANLVGGFEIVRLTTTGTTSTYQTHKFATIIAAWANNESDDDGVGVAVDGQTVTITVGTSGDVVTLMLAGRK